MCRSTDIKLTGKGAQDSLRETLIDICSMQEIKMTLYENSCNYE